MALFMNLVHGVEHRSHITGESVHNQRIKRLWRDVFLHVLHCFYNEFYSLEDSGTLDPENDIHKVALHLAQHGIHSFLLELDDQFPAVNVQQPSVDLSQEQQEEVLRAIEAIADLKLKYQMCCNEISQQLSLTD